MPADQKLEVVVGAVVLVGMVALVALILALDSLSLRPQVQATVYLEHVGGLKSGADVSVAGVSIGRVSDIRMLAKGQIDKPVAHGAGIALDLSIDARHAFMAPVNGEWFISARGLFGERYLEVGPPRGGIAPANGVTDGSEIRGIDPPQLDRFAAITLRNMTQARTLAREFLPEWTALLASVRDTKALLATIEQDASPRVRGWTRESELMSEAAKTYATVAGSGTNREQLEAVGLRGRMLLSHARERVAAIASHADRLMSDIQRTRQQFSGDHFDRVERALARSKKITDTLRKTVAQGEALLAFIEEGRGTLGGFYRDEELADFAKFTNRIIKQTPWEVLSTQRPE